MVACRVPRAFTLVELVIVVAVAGALAAAAVSTIAGREQARRQEAIAEEVAEQLRAERQRFVNDGNVGMRLVPVAGGEVEVRWLTGACADDGGAAVLVAIRRIRMPLVDVLCADRYGRATDPRLAPIDTNVRLSTTPVTVSWDQNGRIFVRSPDEDAPVRPKVEDLSSLHTPDPTPGQRPTDAVRLQPGVLR